MADADQPDKETLVPVEDVSGLLEAQDQPAVQEEDATAGAADATPILTEEQMNEAPIVYESQTIDINGVRHDIINQGQDETGQPVVVLKNAETGDHIVLPLSALVGEAADSSVQLADDSLSVGVEDPSTGLPVVLQEESQAQSEAPVGEDGAVASQVDGATMSCISAAPEVDEPMAEAVDAVAEQAAEPETGEVTQAAEVAADQLQTLADQAGVEQQLLQIQQQPEVNGMNGDISNEAVLQTTSVSADGSGVSEITFDPSSVIDVAGNGGNGASLEALVAGATVVSGEDGNQFVIIPSEDGTGPGQQINLADVIGDADGSGQTYLIQTEDGLVACSAAPQEQVEKLPQSPMDQIASNEQAILEAVLQSGNFTNGQVIHAVSGDQTMAYTVTISSEGAALIPIGPVVNPTPPSPKKILGKSRSQAADSAASRSLASGMRANQTAQARKQQSGVQFANSRQVNASNRSHVMSSAKSAASNQVTVTRINPPSRSSASQQSTTPSSLSSESLLTGVTGPTQLSSSRRTYSKKNILWVNPDSSTKSSASSDAAAGEKAAVPALVSTNSNMTVLATTVNSAPVAEKVVSPVVKKQNPIIQARSPAKSPTPQKQSIKEPLKDEVIVKETEKRREVRKEASRHVPESNRKSPEKTTQPPSQQPQQQKEPLVQVTAEEPVAAEASSEPKVTRKAENAIKSKEAEVKSAEVEPTRRSGRASKRTPKAEDEVAATAVEPKPAAAEIVANSVEEQTADLPASQQEVVPQQVGKRSGRRSTSTEKKEEPVPPKPTRTRGRPPKTPVPAEDTAIEREAEEPVKEPETAPAEVPANPAPEVPASVPEPVPEPTPVKTPGRRGRKSNAEKAAEQLERAEKMEESLATGDKTLETEDAKATGNVRRSGRASKRKVEEDFVSEIEPEALGERPSRKARSESTSPEKEIKQVKVTKADPEKEQKTPERHVNNISTEAAEEPVVPAPVEKKQSIAVTPKKRVGFREAVDSAEEQTPVTPAKRVKITSNDSSSHKSSVGRRTSSDAKLTPILKASKETPKGRRLPTPIVCRFTPYDKEEDSRKLRLSVSSITEKRSHADHYEVTESPNLTIHVRHQSSTPSRSSGTYSCQKCGFSTTRINNLTLHHKNQCPVAVTEWQLGWQNEIKKQQIRTPTAAPATSGTIEPFDLTPLSDSDSPTPDRQPDSLEPEAAAPAAPAADNETIAAVSSPSEKSEPVLVNNNTYAAASPSTAAGEPDAGVSRDICPPSDDEEDGLSDTEAGGLLRNSASLFEDSI